MSLWSLTVSSHTNRSPPQTGIFIREASSRIYSPYVFAIGQLLCEIPYSIMCGIVYWCLSVWPMGFGKGEAVVFARSATAGGQRFPVVSA